MLLDGYRAVIGALLSERWTILLEAVDGSSHWVEPPAIALWGYTQPSLSTAITTV